jgi:uncharacterized membrane protein
MIEILRMIAITLIPTLELRASIPYGIFGTEMKWWTVFFLCVIANIVIGIFIFIFLEWIIKLICLVKPIENLWNKYTEHTQRRISKAVEKYGEWRFLSEFRSPVQVFIPVPLPHF